MTDISFPEESKPVPGGVVNSVPPPQPVWPKLEEWARFDAALFPYSQQQQQRMRGGHFFHYTSGEGAAGILQSRSVWLRSTTCMNDYSEVQHGYNCLVRAWSGDSGKAIRAALDLCHPKISDEIAHAFDQQAAAILHGSYVACFSEHDPSEDLHGRLSMWRAYCNPTGVALVLNTEPFFGKSDALKAYSSPVAYLGDAQFAQRIQELAANVSREREFLSTIDRGAMVHGVLAVLRFAILGTKHPAFAEEREWRIVYTPGVFWGPHLKENVRTVRGVPQTIYDLPLKDIPEEGLVGIEIPKLLHRIIIGPTQYPAATHAALWTLLRQVGIEDPNSLVVPSGVPLRT